MKTLKLSLLALLMLFVSVPVVVADNDVPEDEEDPYLLLCGQADKAISEGKFEDAAARLIDAMSVRPDAPENVLLLSNLGMVYSYMDQDSLALATLDEALRRAPSMRTVQSNRAHLLLKTGRDHDAYDAFEALLKVDSLNTDARYYHGTIALYHGKRDIAEKDFEVLKSQDPESHFTAQAMSTLYSLTGRDLEAIPYFKKLLKSEPSPEYYAALAGCYLALGNLTDASSTISEGMKKYPSDPELYYYRAMLNRDRFLLDDAHADAKKAVEFGLSPAKANALFTK